MNQDRGRRADVENEPRWRIQNVSAIGNGARGAFTVTRSGQCGPRSAGVIRRNRQAAGCLGQQRRADCDRRARIQANARVCEVGGGHRRTAYSNKGDGEWFCPGHERGVRRKSRCGIARRNFHRVVGADQIPVCVHGIDGNAELIAGDLAGGCAGLATGAAR